MSSFIFTNVYLKDYFTVGGPKEKESNLKNFDLVMDDYYYGCKTFEDAEIKMQQTVVENLLKENSKIDYLIGGDLINQIGVSSYNAASFPIPFIGVYSACASFIESMILSSVLIQNKYAKNNICITSSHNLTAERQFRYPVEYGATRPQVATTTTTGAVGCILTNSKTSYKITSATIGKVINMDIKDVNHMGAVMAPAAADTLHEHLTNLSKSIKDYDLILSGDLGKVGESILKEYYERLYKVKLKNYKDAGALVYKNDQEMLSGGSGPVCLPLTFFTTFINDKRYKKILLLGTGSLHNSTFVNQKKSIPSICHAISIEVI